MIPAYYILKIRAGADGASLSGTSFGEAGPGVTAALRLMFAEGGTAPQLIRMVEETEGPEAVTILTYRISRLAQLGLLEYLYMFSDGSSACLRAASAGFLFDAVSLQAGQRFVLSASAFLLRRGNAVSIESASCGTSLEFDSWIPAAILSQFASPICPDEVIARLPGSCASDTAAFSEMLLRAGFLEPPRADSDSARGLWEFHDILFHSRSSLPRQGEPFGGMEPHRSPESPALKPPASGEAVILNPPDLASLIKTDPPFSWVIENRRSAPQPGADPISLAQLSEFFFRTAHFQTFPQRPLPGAGARNEIEFYAVVHHCADLEPGLYHYAAAAHRLYRIRAPGSTTNEIVRRAGLCWAKGGASPHVVIVVAARFGRMASRYAAIAYRNILLDAGIAIHAMYLVATAMQLAPCALGINVPELFAEAAGLDAFEETSIALFALSTLP